MEAAMESQASLLRRVFLDQHNLILLGGALAISLAFSSRMPALVALAAELLWLCVALSSPRLQRWLAPREERPLPAPGALALVDGYAPRVKALETMAADIRQVAGKRRLGAAGAEKLERLP